METEEYASTRGKKKIQRVHLPTELLFIPIQLWSSPIGNVPVAMSISWHHPMALLVSPTIYQGIILKYCCAHPVPRLLYYTLSIRTMPAAFGLMCTDKRTLGSGKTACSNVGFTDSQALGNAGHWEMNQWVEKWKTCVCVLSVCFTLTLPFTKQSQFQKRSSYLHNQVSINP